MGVDQPPDPWDDTSRASNEVQDERWQEHAEPVTSDAEPQDERTRQEHADDFPPPDEPPPRTADSADQREPTDHASARDQEEMPPPVGGNSSEAKDPPSYAARKEGLEGTEGQEEPSDGPGIKPDAAENHENQPAGDPPGDQPHHLPTQDTDWALDPLASPDDPNMSIPATADGESSKRDHGRPIDDRTRSLTDREWAEHITEVRDSLSKAYEQNLNTDCLYTINGAGEVWLEEREYLHDAILEDLYAKAADVPCDFKAIVAGGLGGAGKTTVLTQHAGIDLSRYLIINPDDIKEAMARRGMIPEIDDLSPMEASELAHEESSYLAKRLAHRAQADGKNLIWDITMSSAETTSGRIQELRKADYTQVDGLFVDISIQTSITRIESRHREGHDAWRTGEGLGGRYVPPEVVENQADPQWGSKNRETYEAMKERLDNWSTYDNSVDGRPAELIESSGGKTFTIEQYPERSR